MPTAYVMSFVAIVLSFVVHVHATVSATAPIPFPCAAYQPSRFGSKIPSPFAGPGAARQLVVGDLAPVGLASGDRFLEVLQLVPNLGLHHAPGFLDCAFTTAQSSCSSEPTPKKELAMTCQRSSFSGRPDLYHRSRQLRKGKNTWAYTKTMNNRVQTRIMALGDNLPSYKSVPSQLLHGHYGSVAVTGQKSFNPDGCLGDQSQLESTHPLVTTKHVKKGDRNYDRLRCGPRAVVDGAGCEARDSWADEGRTFKKSRLKLRQTAAQDNVDFAAVLGRKTLESRIERVSSELRVTSGGSEGKEWAKSGNR
ncbi:hypothetical protein B0H16DRAFT_1704181 [Mycena metata]|uniref:Uncharacterized protein n=1 Tax=Mycena metata TaxID=1033252 RepID=A0AAD7GXE6_9AGAR|nr:hypothetical protein B0H16DRAFT_1704181 [Mycena metata]